MNETKTTPCSLEQQSATKRFLTQYLLEKDLIGDHPDSALNGDSRVRRNNSLFSAPRPFHSEVAIGQIRLLSQTEGLTYVAVLRHWTKDSFLIVPFSGFSFPATDEELTMSFNGGLFLEVLQIWNARSAMETTLRKSWLVGALPKQDLDDALLLWKWSIGNVAELPERISERTGVPIYRTDDPRLDYRREVLESFAAFDAEDDANAEQAASVAENVKHSASEMNPPVGRVRRTRRAGATARHASNVSFWARVRRLKQTYRVREPAPAARGAAASLETNFRRTFLVEGLPAKLRGEYSQSEKTILFSVWDKERRVKSAALDGFRIRVEGVDEDVPICNKVARVPVPDPAAEFVLLDPKGKVVKLTSER